MNILISFRFISTSRFFTAAMVLGIVVCGFEVGSAQDGAESGSSKTSYFGSYRKPTRIVKKPRIADPDLAETPKITDSDFTKIPRISDSDFTKKLDKENSVVESNDAETGDVADESDSYTESERQQPDEPENNGTDPTRLISSFQISNEYIGLRDGFYNNTFKLRYSMPFGKTLQNAVRFTLPLVSTDVLGRKGLGIGEVGIQYTRVLKVTKKYGMVAQGEMVFSTATKPELGTGKNVFKGTFVYAFFLKNGYIVAPSVVQSNSLWGQDNRPKVNNTTIDFYIVPRLKNPKYFVTFDPALVLDYTSRKQFGSLAVTMGRSVGKVGRGTLQLYAKPSGFFGGERSGNWGIEVGFKILGL